MNNFLQQDPKLFKLYAMRDALVTLIHTCNMDYISFTLGSISVPITLANLSRLYIMNK